MKDRAKHALEAAGLLLLALAIYQPALGGKLVWNDSDYVTKPALRSVRGLGLIWFKPGATEQYYPLLHSAFWLQHRLWGDAPLGYHLVNVGLHALAAWLLVRLLRHLRVPGAWLAGVLFVVHPVCVETVAWISEQKNTLSTVLYLAAALGYLRYQGERRWPAYALATAFFWLALLSKSVAATLPAALLVAAWWRRGRLDWRADVLPLVPWFVSGAAMGLFTAWVERTYVGAQGAPFSLSLVQRVLLAGRAVWFYAAKLFWPSGLAFFYPRWTIDPHRLAAYAGLAGCLAAAGLLWAVRGRNRAPLAVGLFFVGSLFPVLGLFNVYAFIFSYVADHWQYLPALGVFAGLAGAWGEWRRRRPQDRPWAGAAAAALVAVLGVLSRRQAGTYRDVEMLYQATLARNPAAWLAHNNLGNLRMAAGRAAEAEAEYRQAMAIMSAYPEIHANLGNALLAQGRPEDAAREYEAAVRLQPGYVAAQANLANTLMTLHRPAEAIAPYEACLRLQPDDPEGELNLGLARLQTGNWRAAADHDRTALRLRPQFPEAHNNLANALAAGGAWDEALAEYEAALRQRPDYPEARQNATGLRYRLAEWHANHGADLARGGRAAEAADEYRTALRLLPDDPAARAQVEAALTEVEAR